MISYWNEISSSKIFSDWGYFGSFYGLILRPKMPQFMGLIWIRDIQALYVMIKMIYLGQEGDDKIGQGC